MCSSAIFRGGIVGCILAGAPARAISARDGIRCNVASPEYEGRDARARVHITARFFDLTAGERSRGGGKGEWGALRLETIARGSRFAAANPPPCSTHPFVPLGIVISSIVTTVTTTPPPPQRAVNPPPPPARSSSTPPWDPVFHPPLLAAGLCVIAVAAFDPTDSTTRQTESTEMRTV